MGGPFGNADGPNVWTGFLEWRKDHPEDSPASYRDEFLKNNPFYGPGLQNDPGTTAKILVDNITIAVGMSQFIHEGKMNEEVKKFTREAIERQMTDEMIDLADEDDYKDVRRSILTKMLAVLDRIGT